MTEQNKLEMTQEEAWDHLCTFACAIAHPGAMHEGIKRDPDFGPTVMGLQKTIMTKIVDRYTFCLEDHMGAPITVEDMTEIAMLQQEVSSQFHQYLAELGAKACYALSVLPVSETVHTDGLHDPENLPEDVKVDGGLEDGETFKRVKSAIESNDGVEAVVIRPCEDVALIMSVGYTLCGGPEGYAAMQMQTLEELPEEIRHSEAGLALSIIRPVITKLIENSLSRENMVVNAIAQIELVNAAFRATAMNFVPETAGGPLEKFDLFTGMAKGTIERSLGLPSSFAGHQQQEEEAQAQASDEILAKAAGSSFIHPGNGTIN